MVAEKLVAAARAAAVRVKVGGAAGVAGGAAGTATGEAGTVAAARVRVVQEAAGGVWANREACLVGTQGAVEMVKVAVAVAVRVMAAEVRVVAETAASKVAVATEG
jgi:hypothetical protein